jgi:hypothetical protein
MGTGLTGFNIIKLIMNNYIVNIKIYNELNKLNVM